MTIVYEDMKLDMKWLGNRELLEREKTAFVCSMGTPRGLSAVIQRWVTGLDAERVCVVCGNESEVEQMVFAQLLLLRVPTILLMASAIPDRLPKPMERAVAEGRLLVGTHCGDDVRMITRQTAIDRNRLMMSMAQRVVVGYCTADGEIARSIRGRSNVTLLTHPYNL